MEFKQGAANNGTIEVRGEGKGLGEVTYPIYKDIQEAVDSLGHEVALSLVNVQVKTSIMNEHRQAHSTSHGRRSLRQSSPAPRVTWLSSTLSSRSTWTRSRLSSTKRRIRLLQPRVRRIATTKGAESIGSQGTPFFLAAHDRLSGRSWVYQ